MKSFLKHITEQIRELQAMPSNFLFFLMSTSFKDIFKVCVFGDFKFSCFTLYLNGLCFCRVQLRVIHSGQFLKLSAKVCFRVP